MTLTCTLPAVEISLGGARAGEAEQVLVAVRVARRLGLPAQCELVFRAARGSGAEFSRFPLGAPVTVRVTGFETDLFDGEVTSTAVSHDGSGAALLRVRAYDRLHRLRKRQNLQVFTDVTPVDIAVRLLGDAGVSVEADDPGPTLARVIHDRESDFDLLLGIMAAHGLHLDLDGTSARAVTLAGAGDPVELVLGRNLVEATLSANLHAARDEVVAIGWDPDLAERIEATADAAGTRPDVAVEPMLAAVEAGGSRYLLDGLAVTDTELAARAQASLDRAASSTVVVEGTAVGDPVLRPGSRVDVAGVAEDLSGTYVVTEAVHTLDATGFLTRFSTEPPEPPVDRAGSSLTMGEVTGVDDPEQRGRVKVRLPGLADADAGWMGVLCPGAGAQRGIVALPSVGDTVLVGLPRRTGAGVVLGSLFGAVSPPDPGIAGGAVRRWTLHSADGQAIVVDDEKHALTVRDRDGSLVRFAPGKVTLHSAADLDIQAPGGAIRIRAKTVDFLHAPDPETVEEG